MHGGEEKPHSLSSREVHKRGKRGAQVPAARTERELCAVCLSTPRGGLRIPKRSFQIFTFTFRPPLLSCP